MDGEVCLLDEKGIPNFEAMRSCAVRKGGELVTLFAFDLLCLNGRDLCALPLLERKRRLNRLIPTDHPRLRYGPRASSCSSMLFRSGSKASSANAPTRRTSAAAAVIA